ncbi:alpha/beta fold hydrolase [Sphingomonas sp. OTU376]|uniref:alpha/beta fold hydrolase n=1 Tax=Sphingomonas sp. OTU376 TaxID=3043863 RepID=UPI00313EEB63
MSETYLSSFHSAAQHGPRPLPLFLSLLRSETATSPERRAAALAGLKAYQEAERPAERAPKPAIAAAGRASLRDYGGSGVPVVFVPSLINPPFILDLAPGNSLLEWLATQGVRPLLVDWGTPGPADRDQGIDHHIAGLLLPLLDALEEPPILAGYCLGGTLAMAAAMLRPVRGLVTIAAPWRFRRYGDFARAAIAAQWEAAQTACARLGLVPMEVLQSGFWQLDPARTIAKFERFARLEPGSDQAAAFLALEDWANAGAPLTYAAGAEMFERFFRADRPGSGRWWVHGTRILPSRLACPALELLSTTDRIVPAATAAGLAERQSLALGHVGMIVGGRAREMVWEPLRDWLLAAAHTK